ncbi:MAG TPA: hypothetical protein PK657_03565 [Legionella sp.]|nr:hypothetical protein [Legionella sp.]
MSMKCWVNDPTYKKVRVSGFVISANFAVGWVILTQHTASIVPGEYDCWVNDPTYLRRKMKLIQ